MEGINITFVYTVTGYRPERRTSLKLAFRQRSLLDPHKFTFLHPSGAVSYAILRPPTSNDISSTFPVLLNLHGSGLESDSHQVRHMLDALPELNAWVLFPTGMSPWCGDDWHVWGFADVTAAVSAISDWIKNMNWTGPGIDSESWVVTGHSNGGQGAWFISSHQPDKVIATAAVSGYSSIQNYVPYTMWREASPLAASIIQNSLSSYRHELLVENLTGTPTYHQHGAKDDNVSPYNSRLLTSLLFECGSSAKYVELPNQGHWFEGAMTTTPLQAFYRSVLNPEFSKKHMPEEFEFVIPNSHDIGSRAGIFIDQLQSPDIFGRLHVQRKDTEHVWVIDTVNIHRMHFNFPVSVQHPRTLEVDGALVQIHSRPNQVGEVAIVKSNEKWALCNAQDWKVLSTRYGRQRGSLDAILRTTSCFKIQVCSDAALEAALQVSRNLMQYYAADAEIVIHDQLSRALIAGNVITLAIGNTVPPALIGDFAVEICATGVKMRQQHTDVLKQISSQTGLGAAFLRPLPGEHLELVLWGSDSIGLQQAIRMVPTVTGAGQPDFMVLGNAARWQGHAGVLAMGFFNHAWEISQASYLP